MTLVSLLQSVPCVYYRATIGNGGERAGPRSGLHRGALDRVPRPRRDGQHAGLPARGAVRRAGPLRGRDRHGRATSRPGSTSAAAGRPSWPRSTARVAVAELLRVHEPGRPAPVAGLRDRRRPAVVSREPAGAGRPGHDRRAGAAVLRPGRSRSAPTSGPAADLAGDDPEIAADLAAARAAGTLADDPARGLGQRRDPGLRDRAPGRGAGDRSRGATALPLATADEAARDRRGPSRSPRRRWSWPRRTRSRC